MNMLRRVLKMKVTVEPGAIITMHTAGDDLKFNTHAHWIITEGGLTNDKQRKWVDIPFIPFDKLRGL
jgi:hypothetical protein